MKSFQRLSVLEKTLITALAKENEPIILEQISNHLSYSPSEIFNGIDSLKRRMLLDLKQQDNKTLVLINPILKEYLTCTN